jgi:PAS domain S-box-containing protein
MSHLAADQAPGSGTADNRYRILFETLPEPVFFMDPAGTILDANPAFVAKYTKYHPECIGTNIYEMMASHPLMQQLLPRRKAMAETVLRTGKGVSFEDDQQGNIWRHSIYPVFSQQGDVVQLFETDQDITPQKRIEEERGDFQAKMDFALESSHVSVWTLNLEENTVLRTLEHDRIFGYPSLLPKWTVETFFDHVVPEDRAMMYAAYRDAMASKNDFSVECRIRRATGDIAWISLIGTYKFSKGDHGRFVVGIVQDITDRKLAELEGAKLQAQLQQSQKMELTGQLAGGIAHDFNNVLAAIQGHTEMLLHRIDENHPFFESLDCISHSVKRSAGMISQLLAFARQQVRLPKTIDLEMELEKIGTMLRKLIRDNIRVQWHLENRHALISIDPSQLVQIVTNLCINARDAIADAGLITIETDSVSVSECPELASHASGAAGDFARITISDTGCGIDKEAIPHIFEPFYTTKEAGKGTGLGLSTVYGIVRQNGGHIDCRSEAGKGTTFRICFPIVRRSNTEDDEPAPEQAMSTTQDIVLLVEDEPDIKNIIMTLLEDHGIPVLPAENAEDALKVFQKHRDRISLVVSDIMLPNMNGVQLGRLLAKENRALKFVFMSGNGADAISHDGAFMSGVNFIAKPFSIKDFLALLLSLLKPAPQPGSQPDQPAD